MHPSEQKWRANIDKVAFAKAFPGRLQGWGDAVGKGVTGVQRVEGGGSSVDVILFDDHTFLIGGGTVEPAPADILRVLAMLRPLLEEHYREAYAQLDELAATDAELARQARMSNILGAIRNNIAQMPELYEQIPRLLDELGNGAPAACDRNDTE